MNGYKSRHISSADANSIIVLKNNVPGISAILKAVVINNIDASHTFTLYNSDDGTTPTNVIGIVTPSAQATLKFNADCAAGLTIAVAASFTGDLTVIYQ